MAREGVFRHRNLRRPWMLLSNAYYQMFEWTTSGPVPRFSMLVHHEDADRESHFGKVDKRLDEAKAKGCNFNSMKNSWIATYQSAADE
jgi:hypothetical protein